MTNDDRIEDGFFIKGKLILVEDSDALPGTDGDFASVRLDVTGQDFEKSRFPGTIGTNEAITVARGEFYIDVLENDSFAIGQSDVGCVDHDFSFNKKHKAIFLVVGGAGAGGKT
jgi:hypothetical protein